MKAFAIFHPSNGHGHPSKFHSYWFIHTICDALHITYIDIPNANDHKFHFDFARHFRLINPIVSVCFIYIVSRVCAIQITCKSQVEGISALSTFQNMQILAWFMLMPHMLFFIHSSFHTLAGFHLLIKKNIR